MTNCTAAQRRCGVCAVLSLVAAAALMLLLMLICAALLFAFSLTQYALLAFVLSLDGIVVISVAQLFLVN